MAAKDMGRPKFPKGEALTQRVTTRFRPDEKAEVKAAADAAGLSVAEWLRQVALQAARRKRAPKKKARRRKS